MPRVSRDGQIDEVAKHQRQEPVGQRPERRGRPVGLGQPVCQVRVVGIFEGAGRGARVGV